MRRCALVFVLLVAAALAVDGRAQAEQYRWVDEHGNVHYSDRPPSPPAKTEEPTSPRAGQPSESGRPVTSPPAPGPAPVPTAPPEPSRAPVRTAPPEPSRAPVRTVTPEPSRAPVRTATPEPSRSPAPPSEPPRANAALAPPASSPPTPPIQEIMELSGIDRWLDYLAKAARDEFARHRWQMANPDAAWAVLSQAFRRDTLSAAAATALSQRLAPDDVAPILEMLRSPLSRKMSTLLAEAAMPARAREYHAFVGKLPTLPPPASRVALLQRLERDERHVEFELEMARILKAGTARLMATLTGAERPAATDDDDDEDEHPFGGDEAFRFYVITMMLFAFRNVPDNEVAEYLRLSESPLALRAGQAFRDSLREVVRAAEQRAATALESVAPGGRPAKRKARR